MQIITWLALSPLPEWEEVGAAEPGRLLWQIAIFEKNHYSIF